MKNLITFLVMLFPFIASAQELSWTINFAGTNASPTVDSVTVENLTQQTSISMGGNDLLILDVSVGISEPTEIQEDILKIYPNPASGECSISVTSSGGPAMVELFDLTGKLLFSTREELGKGTSLFNLYGIPNGMFILKMTTGDQSFSGKIISMNSTDHQAIRCLNSGFFVANEGNKPGEKPGQTKSTASEFIMAYTTGDLLKFRGKAGPHKAVVMLVPTGNRAVTFNFIPCEDAEGNHYATVQVGHQFWMAENLNLGTRIFSANEQTNNGIMEKYCFNNNENNCDTYGGLYQWGEGMNYASQPGSKGLCPEGFHLPTDAEWQQMIGYLGGEAVAGGKMKETGYDHWSEPNTGATDEKGFEALPGGHCYPDGTYYAMTANSSFWSSTQPVYSTASFVNLQFDNTNAGMNNVSHEFGHSVRCIQDDAVEMTMLAGDTSKTWKLIRDVSTERYPLEVGPYDHTTIWWAAGLNNDELSIRSCMLNDEWIFGRDGSMTYVTQGDFWADGGVIFEPGYMCADTANMININGEDCSAWGDGVHQFDLVTGDDPKLRALGNGAFVGFYKTATEFEVNKLDPMVQDSVRYNLVKLSDGPTDTLIVETNYYFEPGDPYYLGYWRYVLVHYDDPNDEPPIPGMVPEASFTVAIDGFTVTCTNTSYYGETYLWEFGDGQTATTYDAIHTYETGGAYTISLTVTNNEGSDVASQDVWLETVPLTLEMIQGGPWQVRVAPVSVFVGPGMGSSAWWSVPVECLDGSLIGTTEDWSCMPDDEFTFGENGVFTYEAYGDVRNDGYFGTPNGCWDEGDLSGNGEYFASGEHTYVFTPASGPDRPIITLTNGPDRAAFIGFYKGYYGGENINIDNLPNGGFTTNRYEVMGYSIGEGPDELFLSVDITADHSGTAAWSVILVRE